MDTTFCNDALEEAIAKHETPEIFNTDQESQFTRVSFRKKYEVRSPPALPRRERAGKK